MDKEQELNFEFYFKPYKDEIEREICKNMAQFGAKTKLNRACEYALLNGGKRFRPILVLMMAKAIGFNANVLQAALAVEYFHTASLIADDLPCMDNDDERRSKPSLHKVYGEATALLSSYALISAGYECIANNAVELSQTNISFSNEAEKRSLMAFQNASYNTGVLGATGGQYLDMFLKNPNESEIDEIIHKKTVTLFEISFVFGWLFGGGAIQSLTDVKKAAEHFGRAFQIADDIDDMGQDLENDQKVNFANRFGKEKAFEVIQNEIKSFFQALDFLNLKSDEFKGLGKLLIKNTQKLL